MANATGKISLYNLADLKNTSDDAIPNYLNSLKFKQSYHLQDVRLALGYSAFTLSALCFLWDYKLGFESTKYYTAAAVVVYSLLNGAFTLWLQYKEKNTVYEGFAPSGEKISIATTTKKNVPIYNVTITITSNSSAPQIIEISKPFAEWFDQLGYFVAVPFQELLATSVPLIGKRDLKRVKASKEMMSTDSDLLDAVLAANNSSQSTSADAAQTGSRRRKA